MNEPRGVHPYADFFPMASEEELAELTASIEAVGLANPIVLTPDGLVLDGRNRLEACRRAGVDPHFVTRDGDDDDYKEFVIGINTTGRRESMTVQIAAASVALILGHEKRINGQWRRGAVKREFSPNEDQSAWKFALKCAGLVLDVLGAPHLEEVRDGKKTLNAAYEQAKAEKERLENAERLKIEAARAEEEREQRAIEYFQSHPDAQAWLDSKPKGVFETCRAAFAAYQEFDREARAQEEARKREEQERIKVQQERVARMARYLDAFVSNFQTGVDMADHPERDAILAQLTPQKRSEFLRIESTYLIQGE